MKVLIVFISLIILISVTINSTLLADYARSMEYFRKAYEKYNSQDLKEALELVRSSITEDPSNAHSLVLQGDIYYNMQRLSEAGESWEKALTLNPRLNKVRDKLNRLRREQGVEEDLHSATAAIFDMRVESGILNKELRAKVMDYLKSAYNAIGRDFNYYPKHKIIVLLYSPEDFDKVRSVPEWVAGLYDGKIRIPLKGESAEASLSLKRIIWHEYTHSLIYDITKGKCPIFLNEGLAVYEEAKVSPSDTSRLKEAIKYDKVYPLISYFTPGPENKGDISMDAGLFYLESESLTRYILSIWGWNGMRQLLSHLGAGKEFNYSVKDAFRIAPEELERRWLYRLKH